MDKVFLDTNYFIGLVNRIPEADAEVLNLYQSYISTLSVHILFYINKIKVTDAKINAFVDDFNIVDFSNDILLKSREGPTEDLEDNIQLYSANEAECSYFLTLDKGLLKKKYFGNLVIVDKI